MKKIHLVMPALTAALLGASASSLAQDRHQDRGGDQDRPYYHGQHERRWDGAGPEHDMRRGDRLPPRYRTRHYVVDNWREHRLRPPPRGYQWVQAGSDYVLAAVATNVIADVQIRH